MPEKTDLAGLVKILRKINKEAAPQAVADSLNKVARDVHYASLNLVQRRMIVRSQYTTRSLRFFKANPKENLAKINAIVGSNSPYLPIQDSGGTITARRRSLPIPTLEARGGSRRNIIRKRFRMNALGKIGGKDSKFFVLSSGRDAGIFFRKSKRRVVKVRDLSRASITLRPRRWHRDAVERYGSNDAIASAFMAAARRALERVQ